MIHHVSRPNNTMKTQAKSEPKPMRSSNLRRWWCSAVWLMAAMAWMSGLVVGQTLDDDRVVMIPWVKAPKEVPVFYSVEAWVSAKVGLEKVTSTQRLSFRVHQGQAKVLSVELVGDGKVVKVSGSSVRDWAVRVVPGGKRYLDIHPLSDSNGRVVDVLDAVVEVESKVVANEMNVLLPGPSSASGFSLNCEVEPEKGVGLKVVRINGLLPVNERKFSYVAAGEADLRLRVLPDSAWAKGMEMVDCALRGKVAADGRSVAFTLSGRVRADAAGASLELLDGKVALVSGVNGADWHVRLRQQENGGWVHDLVATRQGEMDFAVTFATPTTVNNDWRSIDFTVPAGVVVPVRMDGLSEDVEFMPVRPVVPRPHQGGLLGYLPPNGRLSMAWRERDIVEGGSLFFSSSETSYVRVGSGLLRQRTLVDLKVLQGKLGALSFALDGAGEVLGVEGDTVVAWSVKQSGDKRVLEVALSRPIEKNDRIAIEAQVPMQGSPLQAGAIRLTPVGSLRHSGWLRVNNEGSVRIDVLNTEGLIQLAPHQFPGKVDKDARQSMVYRFPSADYGYTVRATQVLPEVALSEVTVYELGETDLRIYSDIEMDVHEAPLREWEFSVPADYAVSSVSGAQVADYAVGSEVKQGMRTLKVLFKGPVIGRQLVNLVMAKNQSPKEGVWVLQPLGFSEVKSHRGYIGVVAAAGFRVSSDKHTGLAEVPVSFFPKKPSGLQQAFRLREPTWSASLMVEALGQSIQADVFHLYSLKSGAVYGSVLVNYFVVGSPANEWRIEVPEGTGNIDVTGQYVGRDWRRTGNTVVVPLSRPILGTGTVLLTFEQPMNSRGGKLMPGAVRPLDVQGERGVIQVVSPLQVNHQSTSKGSLLKIDASEVPTEFRLLSAAPTLGAWQYTARDFEIAMDIEWFEPGETLDQVVDFLRLATKVSRDGQWVTDSTIFVKTRGRSVLRAQLPEGAVLLEAKVAGASVNARSDGDYTLVPLASGTDPNKAVEVMLMYGAKSENGKHPVIAAPAFDVPVVIGEWQVTGDEGRRLVPDGGSANLVRPVLAENGWQWLVGHQGQGVLLLVLGLATIILARLANSKLMTVAVTMLAALFVICALMTAYAAASTMLSGIGELEYTAPVVRAGEVITVEIANLPEWQAGTSTSMWVLALLGVVVGIAGLVKGSRWVCGLGLVALVASSLSIHGGVAIFFLITALIGLTWLLPMLVRVIKASGGRKAAATAAILLSVFCISAPGRASAADEASIAPAEAMTQDLNIHENRLHGVMDGTIHGKQGERYLLLEQPAVLTSFTGNGIRIEKGRSGKSTAYWMVAELDGRLSGRMVYEMPMAEPSKGWSLPTGPAAIQQLKIRWNQSGWEFISPEAAKVVELADLKAGESGASMALMPMAKITVQARAKQRDAASEETRFYAEVANLFVPGPGVVNGKHQVMIRPAQGRVSSLTMRVPDGFTVSDVANGPVGKWRFDPGTMELRVQVEPAQIDRFNFTIETQRSAGDLPVDVEMVPLRVAGSAGQVGMIGLAFGDEVQPEGVRAEGLSKVNPEDFDASLMPVDSKGQATAVLQHAFRYSGEQAKVSFRVNAVAAELRSHIWQLVSLGEDRLVVTCDLEVNITRAGVFDLKLELPEWLEVESATGDGLSHWTQQVDTGTRGVTLHLSGKSIGYRRFSLTLVGAATGEQDEWSVPKLRLLESSRATGILTIVPERGLRVRALKRKNVVQIDPSDLAEAKNQVSRASVKPEALSYRMLQGDWELGLSIRRLEPWVTATVLHDTTIREGQVLTKLDIAYRIDNAAVKSQQIRIPGLDEKSAATLRATGAAVADLVAVDGSQELWELRFQRGIAGNTRVALEYQRASQDGGEETLLPVELPGVRQTSYVVALRAGGRLELETGPLPRGWTRSDWSSVQGMLGDAGGGEAPNMTLKVADPDGPLKVRMKRHELANLRKLRVSEGSLTTLMSPSGNLLTAVQMKVKVVDKSTMRIKLPDGAELYNVFVNNEGAPLVREDGDWLFYVIPSPDPGKDSEVRFVYSSSMKNGKTLVGPVLDVPMENLTWQVLVPEGWRMTSYDGDFDLEQQQELGSFRLEDYQSFVSRKSQSDTQMAVGQLRKANEWLEAGDQQKASLAFNNALNNGQLDAASSEDARVQLRLLKTQQAVLGLNSRRQKLMRDNRNIAQQQEVFNPQADRAAAANPILQGQFNYDPKQYDRFIEGNSADENAALKAIANRIVSQQLAAEPAPAVLDITLPERGRMLSFGRSVQVASNQPMVMGVEIERVGAAFSWISILLCLMLGAMAVVRRGQV